MIRRPPRSTLFPYDALPISGVVVPGTGFALQDRGAGFTLEPDLPNTVAPGKRPYHTIIPALDRKSTRLNSSHSQISYAVFCLKKKKIVSPATSWTTSRDDVS